MGVVSPDACAEGSADRSLRPMRISSHRPENSRFHLKPFLALLGGCSFAAALGVMRDTRTRELSDDDSEAPLLRSGTASSSTMRGTSPEDGET